MTHLKKYWGWYTLAAAALVGAIVYFNWDTIRGWFGAEDRSGDRGINNRIILVPIRDNRGRLTRKFFPVQPNENKKVPCREVTYVLNGVTYKGWVGDCKFPNPTAD